MILAEKIIDLRKKMGWSQEELADQLGVSRQSVSKWESAQSIPDMDKIIKLSTVFSVSTDYLLKDEISPEEVIPQVQGTDSEPGLRRVSMEEASAYMEKRRKNAPALAFSTFLCVASPILLIFLASVSDEGRWNISPAAGISAGICVMLVMIAIAVVGFMRCASSVEEFSFLETESFETEYGVSGLVKRNKEAFRDASMRINTACTVMCILSAVPLLVCSFMYQSQMAIIVCVCVMLFVIACAVHGFVYAATINGSYIKLLEEGEFSRENKAKSKNSTGFSTVYWMLAVAASLLMMFLGVDRFWIVYPVAGVLFVPLKMLFSAISK